MDKSPVKDFKCCIAPDKSLYFGHFGKMKSVVVYITINII